MDAAEADFDGKLYKASGDLIRELQTKLPQLIWRDHNGSSKVRTHVLSHKCEELRNLLDRFQEWPQLLDPILGCLMRMIVESFLLIITQYPKSYHNRPMKDRGGIVPLPRALSRLLYSLCKVRGYKVVVQLLNNEPKFIEPMLSCLRLWGTKPHLSHTPQFSSLQWEERYIMQLWLSHLMLAPFELSDLSTSNELVIETTLEEVLRDLPPVAVDVLSLAYKGLQSPSKEQESAIILIARLVLRRDMRSNNLHARIVHYSTQWLLENQNKNFLPVHYALGHLGLLYSILNLGLDSEIAPFLQTVHQTMLNVVASDSKWHQHIMGSAPVRKLVVKILRVTITHAISLEGKSSRVVTNNLNEILENGIQYFLEALSDKDSPVRMAASKGLSIVVRNLDISMAADVVEAILAGLTENILLQEAGTGKLVAFTDVLIEEAMQLKKDVSAVNPLKWHGSMLALGHLLFRKSPPAYQLPEIIEALLLGLQFEQRSNVGTSVGVGVRDAACFGIWALSRKYTSVEIEEINANEIRESSLDETSRPPNTLQLIANRLVVSACFDPSGNIRRGSSAALQELIGRHPDLIVQGIGLVQVVDYLAVARRSRAMTDVAIQASALDAIYQQSFLGSLLDWRGALAADVDSRRWAATALGKLCANAPDDVKHNMFLKIVDKIMGLRAANFGSNAAARHGLLLCLSDVLYCVERTDSSSRMHMLDKIQTLDTTHIFGDIPGRTTLEFECVLEGLGTLIAATANMFLSCRNDPLSNETDQGAEKWVESILPIFNRCVITSEKDRIVTINAETALELFKLMPPEAKAKFLDSWIGNNGQNSTEMFCKGRLIAIGLLCSEIQEDGMLRHQLQSFICKIIESKESIERRTNAMQSLGLILRKNLTSVLAKDISLSHVLIVGLTDYTNDQRGDIGSVLRLQSLEAIDAVSAFVEPTSTQRHVLLEILPYIVRLAAEKLDKIRYRAWSCLRNLWPRYFHNQYMSEMYPHLADVSSESYFSQLILLLEDEHVQEQLIIGLSSSATGSSEDVGRACCSAFTAFIQNLPLDTRDPLINRLTKSLLKYLLNTALQEDKLAVPALDFISFMVEQQMLRETQLMDIQISSFDTWGILQKVQTSSPTLARIEALARLYASFLESPRLRHKALDKLTRQLLHRWPKIRNSAADLLYFYDVNNSLVACDWNASADVNKPAVLRLRQDLGFGSPAATKA